MKIRSVFVSTFLGVALAAGAPCARPQGFPSKLVRIISPYPVGIAPDIAARAIAEQLSKTWNHPVIVEPRPGGNGFIAIGALKKAPADGYTLLLASDAHLAINPNLFPSVPYDAEKDFVPLSLIYRASLLVAVAAQGPYNSIADLITAARTHPGKITYASPYIGSPPHFGGAMLAYLTGTEMVHVAFKDGSQVYNSVANGEVDFALGSVGSMVSLLNAGKIKILAIAAKTRFADQPAVPTVQEAGGPAGYEAAVWSALLGPRGMPLALAHRLNADIAAALAVAEVKQRLRGIGLVAESSTPEQLSELIHHDLKVYAGIVKQSGVTAQ